MYIKSLYPGQVLIIFSQRFRNEALDWKYLPHPSIVPFIGVTTEFCPFCLISPWMSNGDINQYLRDNPSTKRLVLVCSVLASATVSNASIARGRC
jgi:hypothetical protein